MLDVVRRYSAMPIGIQLGHAGRKAATRPPWQVGGPHGRTLAPGEGGWATVGPSSLAFGSGWPVPAALDEAGMDRIVVAFAQATARCARLGLDLIELHSPRMAT
ncbi:hypothetical protein [Falsiroseomonas sp.]|uniref:hypothetical protein n=1 Tax=Falsiroseomonas sp. TaxID=2870721 RepID=UPI0038CF30F0